MRSWRLVVVPAAKGPSKGALATVSSPQLQLAKARAELQSALVNIAINARHAMSDSGNPIIEAANVRLGDMAATAT